MGKRNPVKNYKKNNNEKLTVVSRSPDETLSIGRRIGSLLLPGSVIALKGCLGSGKTYLTKGIAAGLNIQENLTSPTYTIINEYRRDEYHSSPALYHIDAYRLENEKDFEDIGGMEILDSEGICVIEWSERIPKYIPDNAITISLEITGPSSRTIKLKGLKKL